MERSELIALMAATLLASNSELLGRKFNLLSNSDRENACKQGLKIWLAALKVDKESD